MMENMKVYGKLAVIAKNSEKLTKAYGQLTNRLIFEPRM